MNNQKQQNKTFVTKIVEHFKVNWKSILTAYVILFIVFAIFLTIDQLTKTFLFKHGDVLRLRPDGQAPLPDGTYIFPENIYPSNSGEWQNFGLFGIRSIWHKGVTFLKTTDIALIQGLSFMVAVFILILPLFFTKNSLYYSIPLGILLAGDFGNALDRILFNGYVKDMLYLPWADKGTFNLADTFVFAGIIVFVIISITMWIKEARDEDKNLEYEANIYIRNK
ncbi:MULTISPECIES: signal peptidase II [unclassified Mycoplasma]|uniref:signal peptidase II n=1 Tax=unclassified Mycoplasma TaxID=2683645 RepID=UPI002B1CFDC7|nr:MULTISPECIES: signal peptidase II [unclassified Mycoplasma]MEA4134699.1 signal peptidase II [Mycoplasma sp. 2704]MEA4276607.1 signal peptidase II [Mycoplasma sp. 21DD0573]